MLAVEYWACSSTSATAERCSPSRPACSRESVFGCVKNFSIIFLLLALSGQDKVARTMFQDNVEGVKNSGTSTSGVLQCYPRCLNITMRPRLGTENRVKVTRVLQIR